MRILVPKTAATAPILTSASVARIDTVAALRKVAATLDQLGVLVLHLADSAEVREDADPLLTLAEAAKELGVSQSFLRAACARGEVAAARMGTYRMRRSALRTWERRLTQGGAR